jgi:hypothetical protein
MEDLGGRASSADCREVYQERTSHICITRPFPTVRHQILQEMLWERLRRRRLHYRLCNGLEAKFIAISLSIHELMIIEHCIHDFDEPSTLFYLSIQE